MKLYNISDARHFFERVLTCNGTVYVTTPDGETQNLKNVAQYMISSGIANTLNGIREINVTAEMPSDGTSLLSYVANMVLKSAV